MKDMKKDKIKDHSVALKGSPLYTQANFAFVLTFVLFIILLLSSIRFSDGTVKPMMMGLALTNGIFTLFQWFITSKIKRDILKNGYVLDTTRRLGYIQLLGLIAGSLFVVVFAIQLVKKEVTAEYIFSCYMILVQLVMIALSGLNVFKPYVSDLFPISMLAMFILTVVQIGVLYIVAKHVKHKQLSRKMIYLLIPLILIACTGNIFALLVALGLLVKMQKHYDPQTGKWDEIWGIITRNSTAMLGMFFIVLMFAISVISFFTFDYAMAVENNYSAILQQPSLEHPLGTDNFGRDVYSRMIFGARISLIVGIASTMIPALIGGILGALAGYYNERADNIIMRLLDILYAVPGLLLAIAIIAAFGANTVNLIIALSVGSIPTYARTMRANVLMVSNYEFVDAARALGTGDREIIFRYIVPNSLSPMIVKATLTIGTAVIATSSLSYLGLGVEPHIPEWGNILKVGSTYLETHSYVAIFPGFAIIALVLSFNFLGDALRDALDPKVD